MMKTLAITFSFAAAGLALIASNALAAGTMVVTPSNTQGWTTADTRPGGTVSYITDETSPLPTGALRLTTDSTTTAKAQYLKEGIEKFTNLNTLSYSTKHVEGPEYAAASYQLLVDLNGSDEGGFTTFIYEPYQNGVVNTSGAWQTWDVDAGQFWSSRSFTDGGTCNIQAGGGGAPFYTLAELQANCTNAVTMAFGVNIGSNNPNYDVLVDGVTFQDTTYDFELDKPTPSPSPCNPTERGCLPTPTPKPVPTSAAACKKDGYKTLTTADGDSFKNQGQCVSYVSRMKSN